MNKIIFYEFKFVVLEIVQSNGVPINLVVAVAIGSLSGRRISEKADVELLQQLVVVMCQKSLYILQGNTSMTSDRRCSASVVFFV